MPTPDEYRSLPPIQEPNTIKWSEVSDPRKWGDSNKEILLQILDELKTINSHLAKREEDELKAEFRRQCEKR